MFSLEMKEKNVFFLVSIELKIFLKVQENSKKVEAPGSIFVFPKASSRVFNQVETQKMLDISITRQHHFLVGYGRQVIPSKIANYDFM